MLFPPLVALFCTFFTSIAWAAPSHQPEDVRFFLDDSGNGTGDYPVSVVNAADFTTRFSRAALFSRAAYCPSSSVQTLTCGGPCEALAGGVDILHVGGNGGTIPRFFIAHDKSTNTIVVSHEGTDPFNIFSVLNDIELGLERVNSGFIDNSDKRLRVHSGFQRAFERSASEIRNITLGALHDTGAKQLLLAGHSLGAAIATLDSLMFALALRSSDIKITTTLFGSPRVGNKEFADFTHAQLGAGIMRVNNQADPVPLLPPRFMKYVHPMGEMYIRKVDALGKVLDAIQCEGEENSQCADKTKLLVSSVRNHLGPYFDNISFGFDQCH